MKLNGSHINDTNLTLLHYKIQTFNATTILVYDYSFLSKILRKGALFQQNLYSYLDFECWLSHCATSRRSRVQFPVVSFGIFH
jgi:hypothetical protein